MAKRRSIIAIERIQDAHTRQAISAIKERLETVEGIRGGVLDQSITAQALVNSGTHQFVNDVLVAKEQTATDDLQDQDVNAGEPDATAGAQPLNVRVANPGVDPVLVADDVVIGDNSNILVLPLLGSALIKVHYFKNTTGPFMIVQAAAGEVIYGSGIPGPQELVGSLGALQLVPALTLVPPGWVRVGET